MPKQVPQAELDAIERTVKQFPDGASIEKISAALVELELPRRTLQRRLAQLVGNGHLIVEGRGRGAHYRLPPKGVVIQATPAKLTLNAYPAEIEVYPPVSLEGQLVKLAVHKPLQERHPVGYNRAFLDAYRPNETFYLPEETRERLLQLGQSPDGERPAGTYAREIMNRLLIDLSWNSSRLEGNTYSLLETQRLLEIGEAAEGKEAREAQMILNHKDAIEFLIDNAQETGFNRYTIQNLHALLSNNLLPDPQACGRVRTKPVGIALTVYHPLEVPQLIDGAFQQILDTAAVVEDPFEQAFFAMVQIPYLQPFEDVNKRVSRLAANIPLIAHNLCPLSFIDVPERTYLDGTLGVYELNKIDLLRDIFVWAYKRSAARYAAVRQSLGEPDPFRLRYRILVSELVAAIVRDGMDKKAAAAYIKNQAMEKIPEGDRSRFIEVVETELMGLHEGNIARYRLRQAEYNSWKKTWH